jgi:exodeoxyribonuclease-3
LELTLATWNINSVRLRRDLIARFIADFSPDVLCLQEIKCPTDQFPAKFFTERGYQHIAVKGQKGYHGVATVSRQPFSGNYAREFCDTGDARHVAVELEGPRRSAGPLTIHNFYVPAGGDEPDPGNNRKFAHKLAFLTEMARWYANGAHAAGERAILLGDLNIAPHENDVWSHKQLLKVVSHTPIEVEHLDRVQASAQWIDAVRQKIPEDEKLYTWWSYRARDWLKADKGRRLDHIWHTPALNGAVQDINVLKQVRGWERPSDHAPIMAKLVL